MEGGDKNGQAFEIAVPSEDPEKKDEDKPKANGDVKGKGKEEKEEQEIVSCQDHFCGDSS